MELLFTSDGQAISTDLSGQEDGCHPSPSPHSLPSLNQTIACLTFFLLLSYTPIIALPEYKLKVVNICECTGQGVSKLRCLTDSAICTNCKKK